MMITCLVVGVAVTLIQAVTAIRDMTLAIVPKLLAMGVVGLLFGNWMLQVMLRFFVEIFGYIENIGR
jgi:flagellar biosynthetic protein FliQ